ncbi:hypothetical protein I302_106915 [Kwoniella bestiolae CBS 10118]|uniref:CAP-Gly domain-containing protein n=1 Tax=Kwoniella bestiolae CBS 10118 TaxID=1296100 RepID=A0A1B9G010_9TREE|nr:hypothetical protein I302_05819 [Kwoniella bestiolae CBS 10118]OCF24359.1 hypothetical protein I302_05819 [Kwoniella bestiolae CBS 10118]
MSSQLQIEAGPSTPYTQTPYIVGNRYLNAKTSHPLTLRYIGPLPPSSASSSSAVSEGEQIWLGVEYDDYTYGKHNGTFQDTQVFRTVEEGSGSFIKYTYGSNPLRDGKGLVESIEDRYGRIVLISPEEDIRKKEDEVLGGNDESVILGSSSNAIIVSAPNISSVKARIGRLEKIRNMGFEDEHIGKIGGDEHTRKVLRQRMKGLKWLNLSNNLMNTWDQILEVVDCFEALEILTLNHSRIRAVSPDLPEEEKERYISTFKRIKELYLSDCMLSWDEVCSLTPLFPNLEVLHLEANKRLDQLTSIPDGLGELRELRLGGCPILSWEETVNTLSHLPTLENLDLSFTPLSSIPHTETKLDNLKSLIFLDSDISTFQNLHNLSNCLPNLTVLRLTIRLDNPIDGQPGEPKKSELNSVDDKSLRSICISLFPLLASFNSNGITPNERRDAELFYTSFVKRQRQGGRQEDWGRYEELCKVHNVPLIDGDDSGSGSGKVKKVGVGRAGLKGRMITLKIHFSLPLPASSPSSTITDPFSPLSIPILPSAKISLLQRKLCKTFNIPTSQWQNIQIYNTKPIPTTQTGRVGADEDRIEGTDLERVNKITNVWEDRDVGWWFEDGDEVFVQILDERA